MTEHHARCQCGGLTARTGAPDYVVACNCQACQHRTGAPFGAAGYFPKASVEISGAEETWARGTDSSRTLTNHFCPTCGTTLYWHLDMMPDHFGIALGCFEGQLPDPVRIIWTQEKHDWVTFPDGIVQHEGATPGT